MSEHMNWMWDRAGKRADSVRAQDPGRPAARHRRFVRRGGTRTGTGTGTGVPAPREPDFSSSLLEERDGLSCCSLIFCFHSLQSLLFSIPLFISTFSFLFSVFCFQLLWEFLTSLSFFYKLLYSLCVKTMFSFSSFTFDIFLISLENRIHSVTLFEVRSPRRSSSKCVFSIRKYRFLLPFRTLNSFHSLLVSFSTDSKTSFLSAFRNRSAIPIFSTFHFVSHARKIYISIFVMEQIRVPILTPDFSTSFISNIWIHKFTLFFNFSFDLLI